MLKGPFSVKCLGAAKVMVVVAEQSWAGVGTQIVQAVYPSICVIIIKKRQPIKKSCISN